jgi:transcriptional regulator with XRE-family HTH domain
VEYSYELLLEQLGTRIKRLRKDHGWTLRDMVVQHGFHLSHWQAFEKGNRGMSLPSLLRVASVLDVSPSKLLEGLGMPAKQDTKRSQAKKRLSR